MTTSLFVLFGLTACGGDIVSPPVADTDTDSDTADTETDGMQDTGRGDTNEAPDGSDWSTMADVAIEGYHFVGVAAGGDVTGDGVDDYLTYEDGEVRIFEGGELQSTMVSDDYLANFSVDDYDVAGIYVGNINGDVDGYGDPVNDIVLDLAVQHGWILEKTVIIYGPVVGGEYDLLAEATGATGMTVDTEYEHLSVVTVGDLDGVPGDEIIFRYREDAHGWFGGPYVVLNAEAPDFTLADDATYEFYGDVAIADVTGDGMNDLVLGMSNHALSASQAGGLAVFPGPISGGTRPVTDAPIVRSGTRADYQLGSYVAIGDFDGNGVKDVCLIGRTFSGTEVDDGEGGLYRVEPHAMLMGPLNGKGDIAPEEYVAIPPFSEAAAHDLFYPSSGPVAVADLDGTGPGHDVVVRSGTGGFLNRRTNWWWRDSVGVLDDSRTFRLYIAGDLYEAGNSPFTMAAGNFNNNVDVKPMLLAGFRYRQSNGDDVVFGYQQ